MLSEALLASVYELVSDQSRLSDANVQIAKELGYRHGLLSINSPAGPSEIALTQPREVTENYLSYYYKLDPWAGIAARTRYGDLMVIEPDLRQQLYDSEFYVDFAHAVGLVDPLGTRMLLGGGMEVVIGLNQSLHSHAPTHRDGQKLKALGRHLQRALQLRQHLGGVLVEKDTLLAALDRVAFGMAITTADGRVLSLNAAGEKAMLQGCGIEVRGGFLLAKDPAMTTALALLIKDASNGGAGGALRLRAGLGNHVDVLVAPLPDSLRSGSASRSLVAFRQSGAPTHLDAHLLMSTFALSRGEAQVAVALMEGRSSEEIAAGRGVKAATVKSQLQSIFSKTGTNSQRELVRYLSNLPPLDLR